MSDAPGSASLAIEQRDQPASRLLLGGGTVRIGRGPDSHLHVADPHISIVVVTSDRLVDLRRCLHELRAHVAAAGMPPVEVLTVHAPHDTAAIAMVHAEFPDVRVLTGRRRHISEQRNLGALHAR